jgi:mRNA interferase RelE/StbE
MKEPRQYHIEVSPAADRDLEKLKGKIRRQEFEHLSSAIRALEQEPRPHGVRKIKAVENAYRIRVGNYRVVYDVYDTQKLVLILQIVRRTETTYR